MYEVDGVCSGKSPRSTPFLIITEANLKFLETGHIGAIRVQPLTLFDRRPGLPGKRPSPSLIDEDDFVNRLSKELKGDQVHG